MTEPKVIGLHGPIGSGKTTIAKYLRGRGYTPVSFASPLKLALSLMFDDDLDNYEDQDKKNEIIPEAGKTRRELLISLGHDWGRGYVNENLWVRVAEKKIERLLESGRKVVVTDVRYENEAEMVRNFGLICHIDRPSLSRRDHESERPVRFLPMDLAIINNGTLLDLEKQASFICETPFHCYLGKKPVAA
ncbi:MAG: hypothetical protein IBX56_19135 [Methylomicrobium sp.]|nr:hypothetical protein [Methylomicrobium sp.]